MTNLIDKLERADGPDRELDAEIAKAFGAEHGPKSGFCNSENGDYFVIDECAPAYTASIDAAMTLGRDARLQVLQSFCSADYLTLRRK